MNRKDDRVVIHFVRPLAELPRHMFPAQLLARPPVLLSCLRRNLIALPLIIPIESSPAPGPVEEVVRASAGIRAWPCFREANH